MRYVRIRVARYVGLQLLYRLCIQSRGRSASLLRKTITIVINSTLGIYLRKVKQWLSPEVDQIMPWKVEISIFVYAIAGLNHEHSIFEGVLFLLFLRLWFLDFFYYLSWFQDWWLLHRAPQNRLAFSLHFFVSIENDNWASILFFLLLLQLHLLLNYVFPLILYSYMPGKRVYFLLDFIIPNHQPVVEIFSLLGNILILNCRNTIGFGAIMGSRVGPTAFIFFLPVMDFRALIESYLEVLFEFFWWICFFVITRLQLKIVFLNF